MSLTLYTAATPNGYKVSVALEEMALAYEVVRVDLTKGEQKRPEFLAICPNGRVPALVDSDIDPAGFPIMESGAILIHLAEKTGQLMPADAMGRSRVIQWLMFQMGGVGPMLGQAHHFRIYAPEKIDYAIERYTNEAQRLYRVIDTQLAHSRYIAGDHYTIADMAIFPWLRSWKNQGVELSEFTHLKGWFDEIAARPAVQRAVEVLADRRKPLVDDKARDNLFGSAQYKRR